MILFVNLFTNLNLKGLKKPKWIRATNVLILF